MTLAYCERCRYGKFKFDFFSSTRRSGNNIFLVVGMGLQLKSCVAKWECMDGMINFGSVYMPLFVLIVFVKKKI